MRCVCCVLRDVRLLRGGWCVVLVAMCWLLGAVCCLLNVVCCVLLGAGRLVC